MSAESHTEAIVQTLQTAEEHIASEYIDDLPATLASVTARPTYAFMPEPGRIMVITDPEGVRDFYLGVRSSFVPVASRLFTHLGSDWYVFSENVPTRRLHESGGYVTMNTVNLFPRAADGIQGEFLWERYDFEDTEPIVPPELGPTGNTPLRKLRNARTHERFVHALRDARIDDAIELMAGDCLWAIRSYFDDADVRPISKAEGSDEARTLLASWFEAFSVEGISVLTRLATEWYVFAEELVTLRARSGPKAGRLFECRKAAVYPIAPGGLLQGQLGWGTDFAVARGSRGREVGGIRYLQDGEAPDTLGELG